jgi:hypothetical protein
MPTGYCKETGLNPFKDKKRPPFSKLHRARIGKAQIGRIPWNKGIIGYSTKKKGKKYPHTSREGSHNWKGDKVGYLGLHNWIFQNWGSAKKHLCEICSLPAYDWANKNHKYKRNRNDWMTLCRKCHHHYDEEKLGILHGYNRKN